MSWAEMFCTLNIEGIYLPRISNQTLRWVATVAGLLGQFMLDSSPRPAILLCGIALVAALLSGWWYLVPISANWWYPALMGVIGLSMWDQPRGWFFLAVAAVEIGTGLRARTIWRAYTTALAAERARVDQLRQMGFGPQGDLFDEIPQAEQVASVPPPAPAPLPAIPWWRYLLAVLLGVLAAWAGAWCSRIVFHMTGWQLDLLAYLIGYLVGKAVAAGAGNRSTPMLRIAAAVLGGAGVLYGRYLLLRFVLFEQFNTPYAAGDVIALAMKFPGKALGVWLILFVALGVWAGWHYARVVEERQPAGAGASAD